MSCYRPIKAERAPGGEVRLWQRGDGRQIELPCGKCIGCKLDRARQWSVRIVHEASLYDSNLFVTLTYDDSHLPENWSLNYRDFQLFMKRLRFSFRGVSRGPNGKYPIRFFCAGEYGEKNKRPHYHCILFNMMFPDHLVFPNGTIQSRICEELWGKGNVLIGSVTAQSASYVAGYSLKKVHGARAVDHYEDVVSVSTGEVFRRRPESVVMSRRPGIGAWWYDRYKSDVFPGDFAVQDGRRSKVPEYYYKKFKVEADPSLAEEVAYRRDLRAAEQIAESTPERRAVREVVATARHELFSKRPL